MKINVKLKISIICSLIMFYSCKNEKKSKFQVFNNSKSKIDSIKISCSGTGYKSKSVINKLLANDSLTLTLDMNNIERVDGNYFIEIFKDSKNTNKAFGYYSNGVPMNCIYRILIEKDTVIVREIREK